jgi:hypothetical protein
VCSPLLATNVGALTVPADGASTFRVYDAHLCGPLSFTVAADRAWLGVSPASGSFGTGQYAEVRVTISRAVLPPGGPYTASVTVTATGLGGSAAVVVTVGGNPPTVALSPGCNSGTATISALVTADVPILAVTLTYTAGDGAPQSRQMTGPDGGLTGNWSAVVSPRDGAAGFRVTARDAAGRTTTVALSDSQCPQS